MSDLPPTTPRVSISSNEPGHTGGMTQPSVPMSVTYARPDRFHVEAAEAVLLTLFKLPPGEFPALPMVSSFGVEPVQADFLRFGCGVARFLLREGGVPSFEAELITHVKEIGTPFRECEVHLRVPMIDHIDRIPVAEAYRRGLMLAASFTQPEIASADIELQADDLFRTVIEPLRRQTEWSLSTALVLEAAHHSGVPVQYFSGGVFQLGTGAKARLVKHGATDADSAIGRDVSHFKDRAHILLSDFGAPVPDTERVYTAERAVEVAEAFGYPVVVKPADQSQGLGVSMDLPDSLSVRYAFSKTARLTNRVLVQRRVPGLCHRLVTFQGKFVFGFTIHPRAATGDGRRTLRDLVSDYNVSVERRAEWLRIEPKPFGEETIACLAAQGLNPNDVPAEGQVVFLRDTVPTGCPGHPEIITDTVHPENVALVERLSRYFRLDSVGVDLVSTDPTKPWYETGGAVIELNFRPAIGRNTAREQISALFPDGVSTIPIECFVGGDQAMHAVMDRLQTLAEQGRSAAVTSHDRSYDHRGPMRRLDRIKGLSKRVKALLREPELTTLLIVVHDDSLLWSGPPFIGDVKTVEVDDDVVDHRDRTRRISRQEIDLLMNALNGR